MAVLFLAGAGAAEAATLRASSCSRTDVAAAVAAASAGDTVLVPAGTCSWAGGISINGIQLVGAGRSTSGTVITSGMVTVGKHATQYTRLSGFRFTGTDQHLTAGGSASGRPYVIDNNYIRADVSGKALQLTSNGGVLHHNEFVAQNWTSADIFNTMTNEDWSQAPTMGAEDTTGDRNIYLEDNTFTNITETGPDGDVASRLVIRYNTYVDSSIVFHGGYPTDSSPNGGTRHFEVYNNTFRRASNNVPINKWIWIRGSSGVIANNAMDKADSPDGFSYGGKTQILMTVGCPSGYPVQYQVGQSSRTPEGPPSRPLAIFGNTGAGTTASSFISIAGSTTAGPSCGAPNSYIQQGRDFVMSNTWNWRPYTYPHPAQSLQAGTTPAPPPTALQAPTNLSVR
jgi:hypothetical protein